jgi:hypothetical protein
MKKIISGHRYDTDKATQIAYATGGAEYTTDFAWWEESLYRTPRGKWFLVGQGGPMSRYAVTTGNETTGSESLRPISAGQAQEWLEHYGTPELLEKHFRAQIRDA